MTSSRTHTSPISCLAPNPHKLLLWTKKKKKKSSLWDSRKSLTAAQYCFNPESQPYPNQKGVERTQNRYMHLQHLSMNFSCVPSLCSNNVSRPQLSSQNWHPVLVYLCTCSSYYCQLLESLKLSFIHLFYLQDHSSHSCVQALCRYKHCYALHSIKAITASHSYTDTQNRLKNIVKHFYYLSISAFIMLLQLHTYRH